MKANQTLILWSTSYYDILEQSNKPSEKVEKKVDQLWELIQKAEQARNNPVLLHGKPDMQTDTKSWQKWYIPGLDWKWKKDWRNLHLDIKELDYEWCVLRLEDLNHLINWFMGASLKLPIPNAECNYHIACRHAIEYRLKNEFKIKIKNHKIVK